MHVFSESHLALSATRNSPPLHREYSFFLYAWSAAPPYEITHMR